jgi:FkbM family methyltransferase
MALVIQTHNRFSLLQTATRKAQTLCSLVHSAVRVSQDGIDPRSMEHRERLQYLELREALNWKRDLVVYDIGANIGDFAVFVAKLPSVSSVYCFEPIPHVFAGLKRRTESIPKIKCLQVALADRNGTFPMHSNDFSPSSSMLPLGTIHDEEFPIARNTRTIEVQTMTMSEVAERYKLAAPDFIKADVQGFEDRVIDGGPELIKMAKYCMLELSLISLYRDSVLITDMNALMRSLGFRLVSIIHSVIGKSGEIVQIDGLYRNHDIHS